jgi:hypothetical protein
MSNRRAHPRLKSEFAAKVFHVASKRWLPALTCDTSAGGTLLKIKASREILPGDEIQVVIAPDVWTIASARAALTGIVLRGAKNAEGEQFLAVKYAPAQAARMAA